MSEGSRSFTTESAESAEVEEQKRARSHASEAFSFRKPLDHALADLRTMSVPSWFLGALCALCG